MTTHLPKITKNLYKPTGRPAMGQPPKSSVPLCQAKILKDNYGRMKQCGTGGTYTVDGIPLCGYHAGRLALDALVAHSEATATNGTGETADGQTTEASLIEAEYAEKV